MNYTESQVAGYMAAVLEEPQFDGIGDADSRSVAEEGFRAMLVKLRADLELSKLHPAYRLAFGKTGIIYFREMLAHIIKNWDTNRIKAIGDMAAMEDELVANSAMRNIGTINGVSDLEGPIGFFKKLKKLAKKVASGIKKVAKGAFKAFKKFNPLIIGYRQLMLLRLRKNWGKVSSKLRYGYISDEATALRFTDKGGWETAKNEVRKLEKQFESWGGDPKNIKKAILQDGRGNGIAGIGEIAGQEAIEGIEGIEGGYIAASEADTQYIGALPLVIAGLFSALLNLVKKITAKKPEDSTSAAPPADTAEEDASKESASQSASAPARKGRPEESGEQQEASISTPTPAAGADAGGSGEGFFAKNKKLLIGAGVLLLAGGITTAVVVSKKSKSKKKKTK